MSNDTPRIYVACLASYSSGKLHGAWIDVYPADGPDIDEAISNMLASSPEPDAEEWAIHDYEDMPSMGEHPSLSDVAAVGELVAEYGEAMVSGVLDHTGYNYVSDAAEMLGNGYGVYSDIEEWAYDYARDALCLEGIALQYFDCEKFARDAGYSGDVTVIHLSHDSVAVF